MTFAEEIEAQAGGEQIESVVIGEMGWPHYNEEGREISSDLKERPLPWSTARPLLDYSYNDGFGAPECHAIAAYTASKIIMVSQYDGSTELFSVARHPSAEQPVMPGV